MKTLVACIFLLFIAGVAVAMSSNRTAQTIIDSFAVQRVYDIPTGWKDICRDGFKETIVPAGTPEASVLSPDGAHNSYLALPLPPVPPQDASNNWGAVTSQRCLSLDQSEPLRTVGKDTNLLQRTNNYPPCHPDSCSAPSHEFLGTFYSPAGAIRATPFKGTTFPPSTQCA
jgi:hypothetical protein